MTTDDDRRAAADILDDISSLFDHVGIGHVADLIRDGEYDEHDTVQRVTAHRLAAERRGMERALAIVDEHVCQHCAHIAAAIRAEITNTKGD